MTIPRPLPEDKAVIIRRLLGDILMRGFLCRTDRVWLLRYSVPVEFGTRPPEVPAMAVTTQGRNLLASFVDMLEFYVNGHLDEVNRRRCMGDIRQGCEAASAALDVLEQPSSTNLPDLLKSLDKLRAAHTGVRAAAESLATAFGFEFHIPFTSTFDRLLDDVRRVAPVRSLSA